MVAPKENDGLNINGRILTENGTVKELLLLADGLYDLCLSKGLPQPVICFDEAGPPRAISKPPGGMVKGVPAIIVGKELYEEYALWDEAHGAPPNSEKHIDTLSEHAVRKE